jgi:hypothetical protein
MVPSGVRFSTDEKDGSKEFPLKVQPEIQQGENFPHSTSEQAMDQSPMACSCPVYDAVSSTCCRLANMKIIGVRNE